VRPIPLFASSVLAAPIGGSFAQKLLSLVASAEELDRGVLRREPSPEPVLSVWLIALGLLIDAVVHGGCGPLPHRSIDVAHEEARSLSSGFLAAPGLNVVGFDLSA